MTSPSLDVAGLRSGRWTCHTGWARFAVKGFGLLTVRGTVPVAHAAVEVDGTGKPVAVEATLEPERVDTGIARRDTHLRSDQFFDAATWSTWTFRSRVVEPNDDGWTVSGILAMRGTACPVVLTATATPRADGTLDVVAAGVVDRRYAGVGSGPGFLIGHRIRVEITARCAPPMQD